MNLVSKEKFMGLRLFNLLIITLGVFYASINYAASEPIEPIRPPKLIDIGMVELGKKLFYDRRLSLSGNFSCNSCHNLSLGGVDNQQYSVGHKWKRLSINTPTVLNSSLNVAQFWDGRALTLQDQASGSLANSSSMALSHSIAVNVVKTIPGYVAEFKSVFDEETITLEMITASIAEFEKTLVTPGSKFDRWLLGDKSAISQYELSGYQLFKQVGCASCHNGAGVGGKVFKKLGVFESYETSHPSRGRADISGNQEDENVFKVPLLRNIELTYPYFHDGAVDKLDEAVNIMARVQLGVTLREDETARIVAFLKTLTGKQPTLSLPRLPASGPDTPRPQPFLTFNENAWFKKYWSPEKVLVRGKAILSGQAHHL